MTESKKIQICFVCLGNICRSPLAEGVFKDLVSKEGLGQQIDIDSAGTSGWHAGEPADERMQQTARKHGLRLTSRGRQFILDDFARFDLVLAMDRTNFSRLQTLCSNKKNREKLKLFRSFDPQNGGDLDVPDPYYGGDSGFDQVFQIVKRTCPKILDYIKSQFPTAS